MRTIEQRVSIPERRTFSTERLEDLHPIYSATEKKNKATSKEITEHIRLARESLLKRPVNKEKSKSAYDLEQDTVVYRALHTYKDLSSEAYLVEREKLNTYTEFQLVTHIGELLNAGLSRFRYDIKDEMIFAENSDEPFLAVIMRGRDVRKRHGSTDTEREDAEVTGFAKMQNVLCDKEAEVGTMVVNISPPGGIYQHNFYDIYTLKEEDGKRYIEGRRYSSALSRKESMYRANELGHKYVTSDVPTAEEFIRDPLIIRPDMTHIKDPDTLHKFFHKEHTSMSEEDLREVIQLAAPMITSYINTLVENPNDLFTQEEIYWGLVNYVLHVGKTLQEEGKSAVAIFRREVPMNKAAIRYWSDKQTDERQVGCGSLKRAGTTSDPFSVAAFGVGESYTFDHDGPCQKCDRDVSCGPCKLCQTCDQEIRMSEVVKRIQESQTKKIAV